MESPRTNCAVRSTFPSLGPGTDCTRWARTHRISLRPNHIRRTTEFGREVTSFTLPLSLVASFCSAIVPGSAQLSIWRPRKPATVWASFSSTSLRAGASPSLTNATQPSTSPSDKMGTAMSTRYLSLPSHRGRACSAWTLRRSSMICSICGDTRLSTTSRRGTPPPAMTLSRSVMTAGRPATRLMVSHSWAAKSDTSPN